MRVEVNKYGSIDVFANTKDRCLNCTNKAICPLINSLKEELVILRYADIDLLTCGLFKRSVKNVKN